MAKRRKPYHKKSYHECMSGEDGQIHKQRKLEMERLRTKKLTKEQHNIAFSKAAAICSR